MSRILIYVIYVLLCGCSLAQQAAAPAASPALQAAQALYQQGKFSDAEDAANKLPDSDKYSLAGDLLRGQLALSANQPAAAQGLFAQARRLDAHSTAASALLGDAMALQERWMDAAPLYDHGKRNALALQAQEMASKLPYQPFRIEGLGAMDRIRLIHADPVPVMAVRVNAGDVVYFGVDLSADQTVVDDSYAKQLGLKTIGDLDRMLEETFKPGDAKVERTTYSTLDSLALGVWVVHDLPVTMRNISNSRLGNQAGVQGILGTGVLRHFLVTLDLAHGELRLRRMDDPSVTAALAQAKAAAVKTVPVRFTSAGALVHADGSPLEDGLLRQGAVTLDFKDMVLLAGKA